ncbi:MAG: DsbA family protein [Rhizobiaceae bacterium]
MALLLHRRMMLAGLAAAGLLVAGCSDSAKKPEAPAEPAKPAAPASPAEPAKPAVEAPASDGKVDVARLMEQGALPDLWLGKEDAPITIVEYASMTCPHCANFHGTTFQTLKTDWIDTGKVRFVLREFPFDPRAEAAFMLARCAGDKREAMVSVLFAQLETWAGAQNAKDALLQISKLAGFTQESFEACLTDQALLDNVRAVRERGEKEFGVNSTPTFFVNGARYAGAMSIEQMAAIFAGL